MYEMLAGRLPFIHSKDDELQRMIFEDEPSEIEGISDDLRKILKSLLLKDPLKRASIADIIVEFSSV